MKIILSIILLLVLLAAVSAAETSDCDYKIEILLNSSAYTPSDFAWKMKAAKISGISTNITGTARIEDSSGKVIKTYKPWNSDAISRQKTSGEYSPNLNDGQYKLISEITVDCSDIDKLNNIDSKNFEIVGAANENKADIKNNSGELSQQQDSKKEILINPHPSAASVPAENKTVIQAAEDKTNVKNSSEELNLQQKTAEYDNEITLLNNDAESGSAVQDAPKSELIYESGNEKSKELVIYALLGFSVLLNIILIWKR